MKHPARSVAVVLGAISVTAGMLVTSASAASGAPPNGGNPCHITQDGVNLRAQPNTNPPNRATGQAIKRRLYGDPTLRGFAESPRGWRYVVLYEGRAKVDGYISDDLLKCEVGTGLTRIRG